MKRVALRLCGIGCFAVEKSALILHGQNASLSEIGIAYFKPLYSLFGLNTLCDLYSRPTKPGYAEKIQNRLDYRLTDCAVV